MSDYMKRINKVFGKKEEEIPSSEAKLSPTERRKRRLKKMSAYEKDELSKKMDDQGLDFETGSKKYAVGGIVTKAYKNIIKDCKNKSKKKK